jgi:hypothetical protein
MSRLDEVLGTKTKTKAKASVNDLFVSSDTGKWDRFATQVGNRSYVAQLKKDPRSDTKLRLHADMLNKLARGKPIISMVGRRGNYEIRKLPGTKRLGCTCNDWRYRRSVETEPSKQDCKHIQELKQKKMEKVAQYMFFFHHLR